MRHFIIGWAGRKLNRSLTTGMFPVHAEEMPGHASVVETIREKETNVIAESVSILSIAEFSEDDCNNFFEKSY